MPPKDPETWMWQRAREILEHADRVQRQFFQPGPPGGRGASWEPPVDVFETDEELRIQVALPGVDLERLRVQVQDTELVVSGHRPLPEVFRTANVHRLEIPHGRFERRLELPPGTYELVRSQLQKGCLLLNLRKLPRP